MLFFPHFAEKTAEKRNVARGYRVKDGNVESM